MHRIAVPLAALILALGLATPLTAQEAAPALASEKVAEGIYVLVGEGGNIGLMVGEDAVFLIDDQFAPVTPAIRAEVAKHTDQPIRFVVNTHWHPDHTGGNEVLGEAGSLIVAHDNVRRRLSSDQFIQFFESAVPAAPAQALPVVTFNDGVTFHINGDTIRVFHVPRAHTDGDSIVVFEKANVAHMGDTYFTDCYPFIDLSSGGSAPGLLAALERVLDETDAATRYISGHGPVGSRADLEAYRDMLRTAIDRVQALVDKGKSLKEIQAARPMADHDATWGSGHVPPDAFLSFVYRSLEQDG